MNTIHIPSTIDEAVNELGGVERLLTAKRWERAAIVAAFVRLGENQGRRSDLTSGTSAGSPMTPGDFAALGIAGLRSDRTVRNYAQRWLDVHDGIHPEPGADVLLPDDAEWEPTRTGTNGTSSPDGARERLAEMAAQMDPETVAAAIDDVAPEIANAVIELRDRPKPKPAPKPAPDQSVHERVGTVAMIGTALGHARSLRMRYDSHPASFDSDTDAPKLRRLGEFYIGLADLISGLSDADLEALLAEVS